MSEGPTIYANHVENILSALDTRLREAATSQVEGLSEVFMDALRQAYLGGLREGWEQASSQSPLGAVLPASESEQDSQHG